MSGENPATAAEDPPPLANGESAASDKNDAEKYGSEERREVAVTSNDAYEVKSGCEIGTERAADEGANIVETDDTNEANSGSANVVGAVDVKMVETQREANIEAVDVKMIETQHEASLEAVDVRIVETQHEVSIEAVDVKMVETQHEANIEVVDVKMVETKHEANIEAEDVKMVDTKHEAVIDVEVVKMVDTQHEANIEAKDVKMVDTQHEANIDAGEDACQVKEGLNGDNQYAKASEGEDTKMIEAKADTRNSEAQENRKPEKEGNAEEKTNHANGIEMAEKEDVCQKEDKEGMNEDSQDAKVAEADEMNMVEAKVDARNAEAQGNGKKEEMEDKMEEKGNNANVEDDVKTFGNEDAFQKRVKEGNNEDRQDARASEGDEIKMVEAKTDGNAEVEGNEKKEDKAGQTEEKKNNAGIETEELKVPDKEYTCEEEDKNLKNESIQDGKAADGEDMRSVEGKTDAEIAEVIESRKNGEVEFKAEQKKNDANIEAENVIMVDRGNACQTEDKVRKNDDSQDANPAECEDIKTVEAKSDAGNAAVKENERKETKEEHNEEKENVVNVQADDVKIADKEDACRKEDKERKTEDSHGAKAAEGGETMMAESKSAAVHAEVKENGQKEEGGNETEEKQIICMEKQDEDKMAPAEVDKLELDNREQIGVEMQDGLKEEEKSGFDKHEVSDREESVEESQQEFKGEAKGNVGKQEVDDREQNTKEKQDGLEEVERVLSGKDEAAKNEQEGAAEEQEGEKWDGNVAAEKKEEEKQDAKLTAVEKDKTHDGKVAAEKEEEEEEEVNENVTSEKNEVGVIERGVSEKDEEMETKGNTTADKQEGKKDNQIDDICKHEGQNKGTKRANADIEEAENGSVSNKKEKDGEATVEQGGESDKNVEENKNGEPKSKKARIIIEKDHGKDKKQDGSKSREAKNLLSTPSPYSLDRPVRARKTVERLVEVIEKEPLIVEKGRGTPLKNIPGVAKRISDKQPSELKLLHQILFGRLGKAVDFKSHILEFSGFLWHESDEKHRAKAKEKLDKCSIETLLDLCNLLVIPVSRDDIVAKLLDFIAEPRAKDDSTLSDDQGSNSRKRKREVGSATKNPEGTHKRSRKKLDDEHTSRKRWQKYSESESDEDAEEGHEEDDHMKSDSEENKDDGEEVDSEQEDRYGRRKVKAGKKSVDGKGSTAKTKRKAITGISPNTAPIATLSKCSSRVSSSPKSSKDKQRSAVDLSVVSRKSKPITPKHTTNSEKETNERRSSGKGSTSKGKSAEAEQALPSKDELQKTIVQLLKKVDFDNVTFSDILKVLDKRYKMDVSSMKDTVKSIILDELVKLAEADED
ncbi:DEK domain-containing chromatin-associated protein 3-like isoform X3 [Miscanthus floridulus]|uniref:DEK domain-containing chromatin-associated protein 3-like isoform X3 n=1 Tax=Miscanthus floridulus TaxID=154761 RepID=UPI00345A6D90